MTDISSIATTPATVAAADSEPNHAAEERLVTNHAQSAQPEATQPSDYAADYEVGYGRPPKRTRFKPGQSGNPKGRKPKPESLLPDLKRLFEEALSEKVTIKQGDKQQTLTMAEAGFKQLARQYAQGDRHARRDVVYYAEKLGVDLLATHRKSIDEPLAPDRQAILDAYVAWQMPAMPSSRPSRVFAPPELLDDDSEPSE
jgi:hypothetical protein